MMPSSHWRAKQPSPIEILCERDAQHAFKRAIAVAQPFVFASAAPSNKGMEVMQQSRIVPFLGGFWGVPILFWGVVSGAHPYRPMPRKQEQW